MIYVAQYTSQLKINIQDAINAVQDDRTGASVIQEFDITQKLSLLENKHENNLELAKRVEGGGHASIHERSESYFWPDGRKASLSMFK